MNSEKFQSLIKIFYRDHGRNNLPWRRTRDPWKILVSEVMLQQTQVERVIPKYRKFIQSFPTAEALDSASLATVLAHWQGLGYNRRALFLKRLSRTIRRVHNGKIPTDPDVLETLPGIGRSTAGAITAFAFNRPAIFIETNIRRVFIHHFFPGKPNVSDRTLGDAIAKTLPKENFRDWYYALMDYGAVALKGIKNPNRMSAHYSRQSRFKGSRRQVRGLILRELLQKREADRREFSRLLEAHSIRGPLENEKVLTDVLSGLVREGFLRRRKKRYVLASY